MDSTRQCTVGPHHGVTFLGGSAALLNTAATLRRDGIPVRIITAPRHAAESIDANGTVFADQASQLSIDCLITEAIESDKTRKFIQECPNDVFISIGAAWIFKPDTIKGLFKDSLYNMHGTRLPQNRGGGGFSWQIMMGVRFGFNLLHKVDGGIDTGEIICIEEFLYPGWCRTPSDYEIVYKEKSVAFLEKFCKSIVGTASTFRVLSQPEHLSTYWPRLNTATQAWIDWSMDIHALERFICAFDEPYIGASTLYDGQTFRLKSVCMEFCDGTFHPFQYGIVYRKGPSWICVAANGGSLICEQVRDEQGQDCIGRIAVGSRLYTPADCLDQRHSRVTYTPSGLRRKP